MSAKRAVSGNFAAKAQPVAKKAKTEVTPEVMEVEPEDVKQNWVVALGCDEEPTQEQAEALRKLGHVFDLLGIWISQSNQNPGRKFFGFAKNGFLSWLDPLTPPSKAKNGQEEVPPEEATEQQINALKKLGHEFDTVAIYTSTSAKNPGRKYFGTARNGFMTWISPMLAPNKPKNGETKVPAVAWASLVEVKKLHEENKTQWSQVQEELALLQSEMQKFSAQIEERLKKLEPKRK